MDKVVNDKQREVKDGHDGTWIAHPALLPFAKKARRSRWPHPVMHALESSKRGCCAVPGLMEVFLLSAAQNNPGQPIRLRLHWRRSLTSTCRRQISWSACGRTSP